MSLVQNESRKVLPLDVCAKYFKQALKKFYSIQRKILVKFSSKETETNNNLHKIVQNMQFQWTLCLLGEKLISFLHNIYLLVLNYLGRFQFLMKLIIWLFITTCHESVLGLKSSSLARTKELRVATQCPWKQTKALNHRIASNQWKCNQHLHFNHWFHTDDQRGFRSVEVLGHFCEVSEHSNMGSY